MHGAKVCIYNGVSHAPIGSRSHCGSLTPQAQAEIYFHLHLKQRKGVVFPRCASDTQLFPNLYDLKYEWSDDASSGWRSRLEKKTATVDRSSSRGTTVACYIVHSCCDGAVADAAAKELMLRSSSSSRPCLRVEVLLLRHVPARGVEVLCACAASSTSRRNAAATELLLRRSCAAAAPSRSCCASRSRDATRRVVR